MKTLLLTLGLLVVACVPLRAQAYRVDPYPVISTTGTTPPGNMTPLYGIPGASIELCYDAGCTMPATSYANSAGTVACPINAQITLPGSSFCQSTSGDLGEFGFWLSAGTYYYNVTLLSGQVAGPYSITANPGGGGTVQQTGSFTAGNCLATAVNGVPLVIKDGGPCGINQLTGDVSAGPGSGIQTATLATVNTAPGVCGDSTHTCQVTVNFKGLTTSAIPVAISGGGGGSGITQLTGDVAAGPGTGSQLSTLAVVNSNTGACGDSTHVCQVTLDGKGRATSALAIAIGGGSAQITYVTSAPSGTCTPATLIDLLTPNGALYTCQAGTWALVSGGSAQITFVTVAPTGTCTPATVIDLLTPNGNLYTCQSGMWALASPQINYITAIPAGSCTAFPITVLELFTSPVGDPRGTSIYQCFQGQWEPLGSFMGWNVLPYQTNTYNLGSAVNTWANIYSNSFQAVNGSNTTTITPTLIQVGPNTLGVSISPSSIYFGTAVNGSIFSNTTMLMQSVSNLTLASTGTFGNAIILNSSWNLNETAGNTMTLTATAGLSLSSAGGISLSTPTSSTSGNIVLAYGTNAADEILFQNGSGNNVMVFQYGQVTIPLGYFKMGHQILAGLGTPGQNNEVFCDDCRNTPVDGAAAGAACAGGGTGAFARRVTATVWQCN